MSLTDKQQRFVEEYLIDLNATQAAIRAGYSEDSASVIGCENLTKPNIQEAIAVAQKERSERTQVTADMVVKELARIGFSDLRNCLTSTGHLIDPQEWDDNTAAAISSLEVVKTHRGDKDEDSPIEYTHKIKVWDKNSALEKLCKHLGVYAPEKHQHTGPEGGPIQTEERGLSNHEMALRMFSLVKEAQKEEARTG